MDNLIEALQIFRKYANHSFPTACEHDALYILGIVRNDVSDEDHERLEALGFFCDNDGGYMSYRFGSG